MGRWRPVKAMTKSEGKLERWCGVRERDREVVRRLRGRRCPHGDPWCPCPDGDSCHYEGEGAWGEPTAGQKAEWERMEPVLTCEGWSGEVGKILQEEAEGRRLGS